MLERSMQGTRLRRAFEVAVPEGFLTAGFQVSRCRRILGQCSLGRGSHGRHELSDSVPCACIDTPGGRQEGDRQSDAEDSPGQRDRRENQSARSSGPPSWLRRL